METISVIFICMGNICRSPTGEGVFKHYVDERGLNAQFLIDSAGTIGYHAGSPADGRMRDAAARRGYDLLSIARQVTVIDLENFDLIIAMDQENLSALENMAGGPRDNIRMLGSFLPSVSTDEAPPSVPDPYYGGEAGFEEVLDMIEAACEGILSYCLAVNKN
ncbi:MAG: low molecular weight protein-tyrosine-phosphatase [Pseudomonadota bacterium]